MATSARAVRSGMPAFASWRRWLLSLLSGLLLAGVLSVASWLALGHGPAHAAQTVRLDIPAGTAARIDGGDGNVALPNDFHATTGDRLELRNEDAVTHRVGDVAVPAGSVVTLSLQQPGAQRYLCSFHAGGSLGVTVRPDTSPLTMLLPTFLLGLPLGAVVAMSSSVLAKLDDGHAGKDKPRGAAGDA